MLDIEAIKYNEALKLPKLRASIDRLINRGEYEHLFSEHHLQDMYALLSLVEKASLEGNALLIQHEYPGYCVIIWNDKQ